MFVIKIDRSFKKEEDHCGQVSLSYDEVVLIRSALFRAMQNPNVYNAEDYNRLFNEWARFGDMLCYGRVLEHECGTMETKND